MKNRPYYTAYDARYRQVHAQNLQWFDDAPSQIVLETIKEFSINKNQHLLEIGCGEGRDAFQLLNEGYPLLATDISPEAISYCQKKSSIYRERFQVLDCTTQQLDRSFDFIFAIFVLHMFVQDEDRNAFYQFIHQHLHSTGIALICTMGDGITEYQTDINHAFDLQKRTHEQSGKDLQIASTSCRTISFNSFHTELHRNRFDILKEGITSIEPDFPSVMYAVVKKVRT